MSSDWGDSPTDEDEPRQFPAMQCTFMITLEAVPEALRTQLHNVLGEMAAEEMLAPYARHTFNIFDIVCETYNLSDVSLDPATRDATLFFDHGGLVVDEQNKLLWTVGDTVSKRIGTQR